MNETKQDKTTTSPTSYRPIWLKPEDVLKPFDQLVEEARSELTRTRGKIYDIQQLYPGWSERVGFAEGGLTCVISALYPGMVEYRRMHEKPNTSAPRHE